MPRRIIRVNTGPVLYDFNDDAGPLANGIGHALGTWLRTGQDRAKIEMQREREANAQARADSATQWLRGRQQQQDERQARMDELAIEDRTYSRGRQEKLDADAQDREAWQREQQLGASFRADREFESRDADRQADNARATMGMLGNGAAKIVDWLRPGSDRPGGGMSDIERDRERAARILASTGFGVSKEDRAWARQVLGITPKAPAAAPGAAPDAAPAPAPAPEEQPAPAPAPGGSTGFLERTGRALGRSGLPVLSPVANIFGWLKGDAANAAPAPAPEQASPAAPVASGGPSVPPGYAPKTWDEVDPRQKAWTAVAAWPSIDDRRDPLSIVDPQLVDEMRPDWPQAKRQAFKAALVNALRTPVSGPGARQHLLQQFATALAEGLPPELSPEASPFYTGEAGPSVGW